MKKFLSAVLAVLIVTGMFSFNLSAKAAPSAPSEEASASENDVKAVYGIYNSSPLLHF